MSSKHFDLALPLQQDFHLPLVYTGSTKHTTGIRYALVSSHYTLKLYVTVYQEYIRDKSTQP